MKRCLKPGLSLALAASLLTALPAHASMTTGGWWGGVWNCTIDGRPAKMKWRIVNVDLGTCDGSVCSVAAGSAWKGEFSDNGSRWVPLTNASPGSKGGLFFRHADGNRWYLATPVGRTSQGYTTWDGKRYALSCHA